MLKGLIATALAALALVLVPGSAAAEPRKQAFDGIFELPGTNGYQLTGIIGSDGKVGGIILFASKGSGAATYRARGKVTSNGIDIDLGRLGRIEVESRPTGVDEKLRSRCGDDKGKTTTIPGSELVGTIEFRGEEGFTEAKATATPLLIDPYLNLLCGQIDSTVTGGADIKGALLRVAAPGGPSMTFQQNRPGASVYFHAAEHEREGNVRVTRSVGGHLGGGALRYAPSLSRASFSAASPFSGTATYLGRTAPRPFHPGRGTWRGSLKVDFPGDAGVRLAGPSFKASIAHARRAEPAE